MSEIITAIYENGVLRPLAPLELPEHTEVRISISVMELPADQAHRQRVTEALAAAGLIAGEEGTAHTLPLSDEARQELAQRIVHGRPLSEIISEERDER